MQRTLALIVPLALAACAGPNPDSMESAAGVSINEIAIYQGVKRTLVLEGETVDSESPLIAGRDALVRVFVSTDGDYNDEEVVGRLTLGDETLEVTMERLSESSRNHRMETTLNFEIDGDLIGSTLDWSVDIVQSGGSSSNESARFPADGTVTTEIEGRANRLRLVIAPFSYEFDGSGRLPDLSETQIARIRDRFLGMYPVSDVQIRVRDPEPWFGELGADGSGWTGPGFQLFQYRDQDGESDDAYYYGMFNPAETVGEYCGFGGCLLGVTLLNDEPEDVGNVSLRIALGVGFAEGAPDTAAHEIGHSHGRPHSPCGPPGNIPADIDPDYPHDGGTIGVWGYDITTGELHDPDEATDFMGYCDDAWVSDFTWDKLHRRGTNVNASPQVVGEFAYDMFEVHEGGARYVRGVVRDHPVSGQPVEATAFSGEHPRAVSARYVGWDHLPGGVLMVPRGDLPTDRVEAVVHGRFLTAGTN